MVRYYPTSLAPRGNVRLLFTVLLAIFFFNRSVPLAVCHNYGRNGAYGREFTKAWHLLQHLGNRSAVRTYRTTSAYGHRSSPQAHSTSMVLSTLMALTPHRYLDMLIALRVWHICAVVIKQTHHPAWDSARRALPRNQRRAFYPVAPPGSTLDINADLKSPLRPDEAMQVSSETSIPKHTSRRSRQGILATYVGLCHTSALTLNHESRER